MGEDWEDRRQRGKGGNGGDDERVVEDGPGCVWIGLEIGERDAEIGWGLKRDNYGHGGQHNSYREADGGVGAKRGQEGTAAPNAGLGLCDFRISIVATLDGSVSTDKCSAVLFVESCGRSEGGCECTQERAGGSQSRRDCATPCPFRSTASRAL